MKTMSTYRLLLETISGGRSEGTIVGRCDSKLLHCKVEGNHINLYVLEDDAVIGTEHNFVLFGCNMIPRDLSMYEHVWTFSNGHSSLSFLFEIID
jgi:hypothetical protein